MFKIMSERMINGFKSMYDITINGYEPISIFVKPEHKLYKKLSEKTEEERKERLDNDAILFKAAHQIKCNNDYWETYQTYFKLYIMVIRFFTILMFFFGWAIISYNSVIFS